MPLDCQYNGYVPSVCVFFILFFVFFSCRSSILSEVSTRSSSKLPSGKNILVFGKYDLSHMCESLCFCKCLQCVCAGQP